MGTRLIIDGRIVLSDESYGATALSTEWFEANITEATLDEYFGRLMPALDSDNSLVARIKLFSQFEREFIRTSCERYASAKILCSRHPFSGKQLALLYSCYAKLARDAELAVLSLTKDE